MITGVLSLLCLELVDGALWCDWFGEGIWEDLVGALLDCFFLKDLRIFDY